MALKSRDRAILDFEREWWTRPGPKVDAIREQLQLSAPQYYRRLGKLLDDPDAYAYEPLVIRRWRRIRDERRRAQFGARSAGEPPR